MTFTNFMEELNCSLKNIIVVTPNGCCAYNGKIHQISYFITVLTDFQNYDVIGTVIDVPTGDIVIFIEG